MKIPLLNLSKTKVGDIQLPVQFEEEVREDLIHKSVLIIQGNKRQQYGADPMAGNKYSSYTSKRRRAYRGTYGFGISRTPRKILSRRGRRMFWVGATAPQTIGGRRSHPPKSEKIFKKSIPKKERRKAIRSAIAATTAPEFVKNRGHKIPGQYPFAVDDGICKVDKTKKLIEVLTKLGFGEELKRTGERKIRAGIGKLRGRKYKSKKGILIVVKEKCALQLSAENIPGIDVSTVRMLNTELLAPGTIPGRATIWTKGAIEHMGAEKLFM